MRRMTGGKRAEPIIRCLLVRSPGADWSRKRISGGQRLRAELDPSGAHQRVSENLEEANPKAASAALPSKERRRSADWPRGWNPEAGMNFHDSPPRNVGE
jgi:hypothetical protein